MRIILNTTSNLEYAPHRAPCSECTGDTLLLRHLTKPGAGHRVHPTGSPAASSGAYPARLAGVGHFTIAQTGAQFDLGAPQGKSIASLMAALAAFERDLQRERVSRETTRSMASLRGPGLSTRGARAKHDASVQGFP
jgi:hypothetical protein